jgi:S-adenosylmethionine synthetase
MRGHPEVSMELRREKKLAYLSQDTKSQTTISENVQCLKSETRVISHDFSIAGRKKVLV